VCPLPFPAVSGCWSDRHAGGLRPRCNAAICGFPTELFSLPPDGLPEFLTQRKATLSFEADLEVGRSSANGQSERLRYRVGIRIDSAKGKLALADEYLMRLTAQWAPRASEPARIERAESGDQLLLRQGGRSGHPRHEPVVEEAVKTVAALPTPVGAQKDVLALPARGHTVVLGTAGSGKTTMAVLRALHLADRSTKHCGKTLLLTYNKSL